MSQPRVLVQFRDMLDIAELPQSEKIRRGKSKLCNFQKVAKFVLGKTCTCYHTFPHLNFQINAVPETSNQEPCAGS